MYALEEERRSNSAHLQDMMIGKKRKHQGNIYQEEIDSSQSKAFAEGNMC